MRRGTLFARAALVLALLVTTAACGDDTANPFGTTTSAGGTSTTAGGTTTSTGGSTTTGGEATTTTLDVTDPDVLAAFLEDFDIDQVEPQPAPPPGSGDDLYMEEGPEAFLGAELTAAVELTGLDLTGVAISVWPITGTNESLLVLDIDETAQPLTQVEGGADILINALLDSPVIDAANIVRLAVDFATEDEQGPYVFTATATIADLRAAQATGDSLSEDQVIFMVDRGES